MGQWFSSGRGDTPDFCTQNPMKGYLKRAIEQIIYSANQGDIDFDFNHIRKLSDEQADSIMYEAPPVEGGTSRLLEEKTRFHQIERLSRDRTGYFIGKVVNDYRWSEIISHYFTPFVGCDFRLQVQESNDNNRAIFYVGGQKESLSIATRDDYAPYLKQIVLKKFLPILNSCPAMVIVSTSIITKKGSGHRNFIIIETESRGSNRKFNFYVYEPHGKLRKVTSQGAYMLGSIITEWTNRKHPDRNYTFEVFDTLLCPIGLQKQTGGRKTGYCTVFSLITAVTIILIWSQMYSNRNVIPLHVWGKCVEGIYMKLFTPAQLTLLMMGFAAASSTYIARKSNITASESSREPRYTRADRSSIDFTPTHDAETQRNFAKAYRKFIKSRGVSRVGNMPRAITKQHRAFIDPKRLKQLKKLRKRDRSSG
jgi:hypothetical protein